MLNMAKLVWLFNIRPASPETLDTSMEGAFTDGFVLGPKRFSVKFIIRSEARREVMQKELLDCQSVFAEYERKDMK